MLNSYRVALAIGVLFLSRPVPGLEKTAMDRLLELARSQPDSPAFREALVKSLGEPEIKKGEAFNSNGPDFIFAVENARQPMLVIDDQPAG